jgi:hypothetical protein
MTAFVTGSALDIATGLLGAVMLSAIILWNATHPKPL